MADPAVDTGAAAHFLDFMARGELLTFQSFDDTPAKRRSLATIRHGQFTACEPALRDLNARGAGIFWMVNRGDGKGRAAANVASIRALFLDLDGAPLQPVLEAGVAPHAVVESSPGKWHAYWQVSGCPTARFKEAQQALARRFGGDQSVCDLPRVLRVPGFLHRKGEPFVSRIERLSTAEPYAFDELTRSLHLKLPPESAPAPKAALHVDAVTGEILDKIGEGGRHAHLVKWAGELNWRGIPAEAIRTAVHAENERRCDPPKSADEVDAIVTDVLKRYESQHGRDLVAVAGAAQGASGGTLLFKDVDLSHLGSQVPPQEWFWQGWMPAGHVTLLSGHGGAGKSTFALMLAAALCAQDAFLGSSTKQGRVLFFSGEDPEAVVLRRLARICDAMRVGADRVRLNLRVIDATAADPVLFTEQRQAGVRAGVVTRTYHALAEYIEEHDIDVLIVDNASDVFDGEEINRSMVRGFIRSLAGLVRQRNGAVLLLAHVDKATSRAPKYQANAESYSGSTAWHNSVRSRLFLMEREPGVLELRHEKSNLGRKHEPLVLVWPDGALPQLPAAEAMGDDAQWALGSETAALLALVHEYGERGEWIAPAPNSPRNAARLFAGEPSFPKRLKARDVAMRLRDAQRAGLIVLEQYRSADRKPHERWALTQEGRVFIGVAPSAPSAPSDGLGADGAGTGALRQVRHVRTGGMGVERAHEARENSAQKFAAEPVVLRQPSLGNLSGTGAALRRPVVWSDTDDDEDLA